MEVGYLKMKIITNFSENHTTTLDQTSDMKFIRIMGPKSRKLILGTLIGLIVIISLVLRFTRRVPPFEPTYGGQISTWGTVDNEVKQELQSVLDNHVNQLEVPGLQAFVITPDGKTWSGASGTIGLTRKDLLQRDHVLRVGSVTKSFTAVLILKMVEGGFLNLDEPIAVWFPDLPSADPITIRQLLNHSSGIPEIIPKVLLKSVIPSTYWERDELLKLIIQDQPHFTPGSKFDYSNSNYILLGLIAEEVSGKPITQLLHEQIIDPLNLKHTYFIPYEQAPARLVPGFDRDMSSFPGMLDIRPQNTSWATAAYTSGALASNAENLGVFYYHLFAEELLLPSIMKEMTTFIEATNPSLPEQIGSGLGLMQLQVDGQELVGHVGHFMGSTAIVMHSTDKNYTIAVTCNLSIPDLVEVLVDLQRNIRK
jgi:D-alanyl-D-alanine carboxypeptidase